MGKVVETGGKLRCPICGNTVFDLEEGKIDSKWRFTTHKVKILVCRRCGYVILFYEGRTI